MEYFDWKVEKLRNTSVQHLGCVSGLEENILKHQGLFREKGSGK